MRLRAWVHRRTHHSRRHDQIHRQRLIAVVMIASGLLRVLVWATLIILYLLHVPFARNLYASVSFVALLSVLALMLTDWGQVAASLAQLTAGDVHHDVRSVHEVIGADFKDVETDIEHLAELQPGPEAKALASEIRTRLAGKS